MATTVEALIGAAYQDGGDLAVEQVISQLEIDHEHFHAVTYMSLQHTSFKIRHSPLTNRVLVFGLYVWDFRTVFARAPGNPYASQTILPWAVMVMPSQSTAWLT